jgi:hypothetical protein
MAEKAAKPVKLVSARWVATYEARFVDGTQLVPGETVVKIPEPEAEASANWEIVGGKGKSSSSKKPTVKDLKAEAQARGIELPPGVKKADIEALLDANPAESVLHPKPEPEAAPEHSDDGESPDGSAD